MFFSSLFESFTLFFTIINPIGTIPLFIALTQNQSEHEKRKTAFKAVAIATIIFICFALVGELLLKSLNISESAFRIAGGILLLLTAIDMVLARHSGISATTKDEEKEADHRSDVSVFPLAIPIIAGPGGLMAVAIQLQSAEGAFAEQAAIMGILVLVMGLSFSFFYAATTVSRYLGVTGANVLTRVLGMILASLAVQFILDGIQGHLA